MLARVSSALRGSATLIAGTAVVALALPVGAAAWVHASTRAVAAHFTAAAGVPVALGGIDADLTGCVRLADVSLGSLVHADAVEASVGLDSLLAGRFGADEIRVEAPRVAIDVGPDGDSDLARLVRRLVKPRAGRGAGPGRLRRIVVSEGSLVAHVAGLGELAADDVEIVPDAGGVRVITGPLRVRAAGGALGADLVLGRSAAEVALPHVTFGRVLAVGGEGSLADPRSPGSALALHDVAIGRLEPGGKLEAHATLGDGSTLDASVLSPGHAIVHGTRVPLAAFASLAPHALGVAGAYASGTVEVSREAGHVAITGDGSFEHVRVMHPMLGEAPLELSAHLRGALAISPDSLAIDQLAVDVGPAHWTLGGWVRRGQPMSASISVGLAQANCADLLAALPLPLRGPLDGMAMTGTFGGRAHVAIDLAAPLGDGVQISTELANQCDVTAEPPAADVTAIPRDNEVTLDHLPAFVPDAFIAAEDSRFYSHHGFDPVQIGKSLEIDLRDRAIARGGSTISQQLVKNVFLTQRRTLDRKLQEALLTWRLEARLTKQQILERYLNVIELGPHVFGIGAAARFWFDKPAHDLTVRQAAFLAALTSEPTSMTRRVRAGGGLDADSRAHVETVLRAMRSDRLVERGAFDDAMAGAMHFAKSALGEE